jgi:response regulator NasT
MYSKELGKMIKVLVIDDDPMMLKMAGLLLKKAGCETVSALSADEGEALIPTEKPDLVLADNEMPVRTGMELFEKLRAQGCTVPLCIMTGTVTDEIEEQASRLGADCIGKPLVIAKVNEIVSKTENGGR